MIFVEKALSMMNSGYAAIIIQSSAGSGKATEYNQRILKDHTLIASIEMPGDLFLGKSNVSTRIYVFQVGQPHHKDDPVKFIDFSDDGYTRSNRKKARSNLRNTNNALERYQEVADLVRFGKHKLNYLSEKEYFEGYIDPTAGDDWNQSPPSDTIPKLADFQETVADYLSWELTEVLHSEMQPEDPTLGKS